MFIVASRIFRRSVKRLVWETPVISKFGEICGVWPRRGNTMHDQDEV